MVAELSTISLEVEDLPTGLPNLIPNPSAEKGTWGWETPVANSTLGVIRLEDPTRVFFEFFASVLASGYHFTSTFLPVAASKFVGAQLTTTAGIGLGAGTGEARITFLWYNSAKVLLSESVQSAVITNPGDGVDRIHYAAPIQSPANTAFVKMKIALFSAGGAANFQGGFYFKNAMVTWADSTASLGGTRTNQITNPSFELSNANGWTYEFNIASKVSVTDGVVGTKAFSYTFGSNNFARAGFPGLSVTPDTTYTFQISMKQMSGATGILRVGIQFLNSSGVVIEEWFSHEKELTTGSWVTHKTSASTAPLGAVTAVPFWNVYAVEGEIIAGAVVRVDGAIFEKSSQLLPSYFDGATADTGGVVYSWTGTANASTSTAVSTTNYAFTEPFNWKVITSSTFEIDISRDSLDISTLVATLYIEDEELDPALSEIIQPGKRFRLRVLTGNVLETAFEGKIDDPSANYIVGTTVHLRGVNNVSQLANITEKYGVASIGDLPFILEGHDVPWNCNGNGGEKASATQVSELTDKSILDQVVLTRDSVFGYAWFDRENVLQVWDENLIPTDVEWEFSDKDWGVIDRKNYITNPALTNNTTGWAGQSYSHTHQPAFGEFSAHTLADTDFIGYGGNFNQYVSIRSVLLTGAAGKTFSGAVRLLGVLAGSHPNFAVRLRFLNSSFSAIGHSVTSLYLNPNFSSTAELGWFSASGTAPANTAYVELHIGPWESAFASNDDDGRSAMFLDEAIITEGEFIQYFDGNNFNAVWDGTADASTSTRLNSKTAAYSNMDIGYDTNEVINEVLIKFLQYNTSTHETTEVTYGPYVDFTSRNIYGPHKYEITIHALTENATNIQNLANEILAANKTPSRTARSLTVPIVDDRHRAIAARADIYSLVSVVFQDKLEGLFRITGISQSINQSLWEVEYQLKPEGKFQLV